MYIYIYVYVVRAADDDAAEPVELLVAPRVRYHDSGVPLTRDSPVRRDSLYKGSALIKDFPSSRISLYKGFPL